MSQPKPKKSPKAVKNEVLCLMGGDVEISKAVVELILRVLSQSNLRSQELWEQVLLQLGHEHWRVKYEFCINGYFEAESDEERAAWAKLSKQADQIENKFVE